MTHDSPPESRRGDAYSIGDVAEMTGLSPDTIRVWERRYGRPMPVRLESGHRRYTSEHVRWLRRVAAALALGHRPSALMHLDETAISELLGPAPGARHEAPEVSRLLELAREFDGLQIRGVIHRGWTERGARDFLESVLMPALERVGQAWADGTLDIRHEHFVSELIQDELRGLRSLLPENPEGTPIVVATLSGEEHGLGIQVAALIARLAGARAWVLGVSVPNEEIAHAAAEVGARGVAIGVSLATGGFETDRRLAHLRDLLPQDVRLLVGGKGARGVRRGLRNVDYVEDLDSFEAWVRALPR